MTKKRASKTSVRRISTKRDFEHASVLVGRLSDGTKADSADELRLQALLREMDKFDEEDEAASVDTLEDDEYSGPRRRWSDDNADPTE